MGFMIPGGKTKGTPLEQADESSLKYWFGRISGDLASNPEKDYADRDRQWLATAKAEMVKRFGHDPNELVIPQGGARTTTNGTPAAQRPPANGSALAKSAPASQMVVGSAYDPSAVNKMLEEAMSTAHLVSPATVCGSLPPGCEVAISLVMVDPRNEKEGGTGEVADVGGGKLSLSGNVLKKIGAAAGVSWDMNASGRLDDGSDPHYAHYRAVGHVRNFDGSVRTVSGEVEIDMREGSPQIEAMTQRSKTGNVATQIRDTRLFLLRHAETKAKLRAIADMGVKRSYTRAELAKPFKVARLMWTGHSDDPELRRVFAEKTADAMIGATSMLYGGQPAPAVRPAPPMMASAPPAPMLHAPPPVGGGVVDDPYGRDDSPGYIDAPQAQPTPRPTTPAQQQAEDDGGFAT